MCNCKFFNGEKCVNKEIVTGQTNDNDCQFENESDIDLITCEGFIEGYDDSLDDSIDDWADGDNFGEDEDDEWN